MSQRYCNRCGKMVEEVDYDSDNEDYDIDDEYTYWCPQCDEDLYTFETHEELT